MNTSLKWIKDLVPGLDCTPQEYMDAMTLSGSQVEGYENMDEDLDKIVIGQVKSIEKQSTRFEVISYSTTVSSNPR